MRFRAILLLIFLFFLLSGCSNKIKESNFNDELMSLRVNSNKICISKSMEYVGVETLEYGDYRAICMLKSPAKIYRFKVEK